MTLFGAAPPREIAAEVVGELLERMSLEALRALPVMIRPGAVLWMPKGFRETLGQVGYGSYTMQVGPTVMAGYNQMLNGGYHGELRLVESPA